MAAPAFLGSTGFFLDDGVLQARPAADPTTANWTFTGDGQLIVPASNLLVSCGR